MRKVTGEEFYRKIGPLNVHPQIQGSWPYTSLWKLTGHSDSGRIVGKSVDVFTNGVNGLTHTEYYLNDRD
jgi:hypothetical protein